MQAQITLKLGTANRTISAPAKLTQATVKAALRDLGITFKKTEWNEYRVNYAGGNEDTAAYETDLESAFDTGKSMAEYAEKNRFKAANVNATSRHRLGSSDFVHAPSIVAWAQSGYWNKPDRAQLVKVIAETWNVPVHVATAVCEGKGATVGDTYEIEA